MQRVGAMEFTGRKAELVKLDAECEHDGSFAVIYGRRPYDQSASY